jgi:hypothetical protein
MFYRIRGYSVRSLFHLFQVLGTQSASGARNRRTVGGTSRLLAPLVEALRTHVMSGHKLHADDTPVPVLAPGLGKSKTGRLWTYVRDDRPAADPTPPAVWICYSADRKGEHSQQQLSTFTGTLQADVYAGFDQIYEAGRIEAAACWAHVRRKFYEWWKRTNHRPQPRPWNESLSCMPWKKKSGDFPPKNDVSSATSAGGHCWNRSSNGSRRRWGSGRENRIRCWLGVTRWDAGRL